MKNLTWQNPEQLFVAQVLINKVKSKCCGIKEKYYCCPIKKYIVMGKNNTEPLKGLGLTLGAIIGIIIGIIYTAAILANWWIVLLVTFVVICLGILVGHIHELRWLDIYLPLGFLLGLIIGIPGKYLVQWVVSLF